jgi:hypothetical protein
MATLTIKDLPDSKELDRKEMATVYGGFFAALLRDAMNKKTEGNPGQNDPAQQFQQILQQLTTGN